MQFVENLPRHVYVGQTKIDDLNALATSNVDLHGLNLALHVGDDNFRVQQHRMQLLHYLTGYGVKQLTWCNQTHSTICHRVDGQAYFQALTGDGLVTSDYHHALMMMTADCLPIVLGDANGQEVANLHAGWRGLANGIIEQTLAKMQTKAQWAWLGCAISQPCFEVGEDVKQAFIMHYGNDVLTYFAQGQTEHKYWADLYGIARYILQKYGVSKVLGGESCSYRQSGEYYSYRRNAKTGRMATFAFLAKIE